MEEAVRAIRIWQTGEDPEGFRSEEQPEEAPGSVLWNRYLEAIRGQGTQETDNTLTTKQRRERGIQEISELQEYLSGASAQDVERSGIGGNRGKSDRE